MNSSRSKFCPDPLWDSTLTWLTEDPDFTTCFHETVLVFVPCGLLWLLAPLQIHLSRQSKDSQVPWSVLPITKFSLSGLLLVLALIDLVYQISSQPGPSVYITASVIKIITYALMLSLQWHCKKRGLVTSGT